MSKNKVIVLSLAPAEMRMLQDLRAHYNASNFKVAAERALLDAWRMHCEAEAEAVFDFEQDLQEVEQPRPRRRTAQLVNTAAAPMTAAERVRARGAMRRAQVVATGEMTKYSDGLKTER